MKWIRRGLILVLVLGALWGVARWYTTSKWNSLQTRVQQRIAALGERDRTRPVLWGESAEGEAFPEYLRALAGLDDPQMHADLTAAALALAARGSSEPGAEATAEKERARLVEATAAAVAQVRLGAHRAKGVQSVAAVGDFLEIPSVVGFESLGHSLTLHAAQHMKQGADQEAVSVMLDSVQLGGDLAEDPILILGMISSFFRVGVLSSLFLSPAWDGRAARRPPFRLQDLEPEALRRLHAGLGQVAVPPTPLSTRAEIESLLMFQTFDRLGPGAWTNGMQTGSLLDWLLSSRVLVVDCCEERLETAKGLPGPDVPWLQAKAVLAAGDLEVQKRINPMTKMVAVSWASMAAGIRSERAKFGLVRLAVADALGETIAIPDPFTPSLSLRSRREPGGTVYWSVGENGVDDGGDPKKDIVLNRPAH